MPIEPLKKNYIGSGDWKYLTKCQWCGEVYANHDDPRPEGSPIPRVPCLRLKTGFLARTEKLNKPESPMKTEQELRESWIKAKIDQYGWENQIETNFEADFWLNKRREELNALIQEVEGMKQPEPEWDDAGYAHNKVIHDVLDLLRDTLT